MLTWTGEDAASKPKHSMVPVLTLLFMVAYGMMLMLIVEQARTIDTQRNLIRVLFDDSAQLSAMKGKAAQQQYAESQAKAKEQAPSNRAPSTQARTQNSQAQTPSSQVTPQAGAKSERSAGKIRKPAPLKPPKDTSDDADERRTLITS